MKTSIEELKEKQPSNKTYQLSSLKQDVLERKLNKIKRLRERKMKKGEKKASWKEVSDSIAELKTNLTNISLVGIHAYNVLKEYNIYNDIMLVPLTTKTKSLMDDVNHYHKRILSVESTIIHTGKEVKAEEYGLFLTSFENLNEIFTDTNRVLLPTVVEIQDLLDTLSEKYDTQKTINTDKIDLTEINLLTATI